ncbi:MAG TPA: DUF922 domain-containing protein [Candidatus Dormibacteraeota bacterium]|nr:DUF922 domain-containing protein [Candidatus Dormibacteraeota bacterium]
MGGPIRGIVAGLLVLAIVGLLIRAQQLRDETARQNAEQAAELQALKERWFGTPAIWQPPAIPNTTIQFFDVSGVNQRELINSLNNSDLCVRFGPCASDPLNPKGAAWGLAGAKLSSTSTCASPTTTTLLYKEFVVLPRWQPPTDGSINIPLVQKWNALAQVIYVHESGHVAITKAGIAALNDQAHQLPTCDALEAFWNNPKLFDKIDADQLAYHARLYANCHPEVGCIPPEWMGW